MLMTSGATTTTTVSVSWSPVPGATGYYVSYQRQDLGTPPVVTPQYERIVGGANTSVTLSGLEPQPTGSKCGLGMDHQSAVRQGRWM